MSQDDTDWGWRWDEARERARIALDHLSPDDAIEVLRLVLDEAREEAALPTLAGAITGTGSRRQRERRR